MQRSSCVTLLCLAISFVFSTGCGKSDNLLIAKGKVQMDGDPLIPDEGQSLTVGFVPISQDGQPARNFYVAEVNQKTGTFVTSGAQKKGLPPGKYRVSVELLTKKKDAFNERYNGQDSPIVVDIKDLSKPILVEVEAPKSKPKAK